MAIQDYSGLLSGVITPQEQLEADQAQGTSLSNTIGKIGGTAAFYAPQRNRQAVGGLGRILGIDTRNPQEQVQEQVMGLLQANTVESLGQAVQLLQQAGDTQGSFKVMQAMQAMQADASSEAAQRAFLAAQFPGQDLATAAGTDLTTAQLDALGVRNKTAREAEETAHTEAAQLEQRRRGALTAIANSNLSEQNKLIYSDGVRRGVITDFDKLFDDILKPTTTAPLSPYGKSLVDMGQTPGTPQFQAAMLAEQARVTAVPRQTPQEQLGSLDAAMRAYPTYDKVVTGIGVTNRANSLLDSEIANPTNESQQKQLIVGLQRELSGLFDSNTRAAEEINRFISSKTVARGLADWFNSAISGDVTKDTIDELKEITNAISLELNKEMNGIRGYISDTYGAYTSPEVLDRWTAAQRELTAPYVPGGSPQNASQHIESLLDKYSGSPTITFNADFEAPSLSGQ